MPLKKNTNEAPAAVRPQVNNDAYKAPSKRTRLFFEITSNSGLTSIDDTLKSNS